MNSNRELTISEAAFFLCVPERDLIELMPRDPLLTSLSLANIRSWIEREYDIRIDTSTSVIPPYEN